MTLKELFLSVGENQNYTIAFFTIIPICAFLVGIIGGQKDHLSPWKYIYTILIYLISIPGIFAVGLTIYFFLFQRGDIMQTNLLLQILPIVSMIVTIAIMRNNVNLDYVPGFDKISGLWLMLFATMFFMWFLEKIHIVVFSYLPFQYLLGIFALLFFVIYFGWRKFVRQSNG
ncbi:hypothetical protein [Flavobacterium sp.]|uniref:hypothetical protein n=1 Tax=Flavobacterium sp. TaxID=239 RepID=UPI00286DE29E|nr:hypothetical protein [Flavobacterium sp.]